MDLQSLQSLADQLASITKSGPAEKVEGLTDEQLLERHAQLVAERDEWTDATERTAKASNTNRAKRIEEVLTERGVEFESIFVEEVPLTEMSDDELVEEFNRQVAIRTDDEVGAGKKASATKRMKAIIAELTTRENRRKAEAEAQAETGDEIEDEVEVEPEPEPATTSSR